MRSTKKELVTEIKRIAAERKKDRKKTQFTIAVTSLLSLILIGGLAVTTSEYKNARADASKSYSQAADNVCEQRSATWDAMQTWITTQKTIEVANPYISEAFRSKRIAALDELLKSFPDVNCDIGSALTMFIPPSSFGSVPDSALSVR